MKAINLSQIWGSPRLVHLGSQMMEVPYILYLKPDDELPLCRWISSEGLKTTCKRLKDLKLWAIHLVADDREFTLPWIRKTRYRSFWIPNFGLFRTLIDARLSSQWDVVRTLLAYLSSYKLFKPTIGSLESIIGPEEISLDPQDLDKLLLYVRLPTVPEEVLSPVNAVLKNTAHAVNYGQTVTGPMGYPDPACDESPYGEQEDEPDSIGRLDVVPDKGKARVILIGHYRHQLNTKNLADWLRNYLWNLPEIASGNQQKMIDFVKSRMSSGWKFASLDQSQATDRLSRATQVAVLERMGVPPGFLSFLDAPFWYKPKQFGLPGDDLRKDWYGNGQPMGLYISFPMYELLHYICAKVASATSQTEFSICGDDIVFAGPSEIEVRETSRRYTDYIESLGGVINPLKTISGNVAEAVGGLFVHVGNTVMEIRTPSGSLSPLELTVNSWVKRQVSKGSRLGLALEYSWLSPTIQNRYTEVDRRNFWRWLIENKLHLDDSSLRDLTEGLSTQVEVWDVLEGPSEAKARAIRPKIDRPIRLTPVSKSKLSDARVTSAIKLLYKKGDSNDSK